MILGVGLLMVAVCSGCDAGPSHEGMVPLTVYAPDGGKRHVFQVEVAATEAKRNLGLMYRKSVPADEGMLFVFQDIAPRAFWMKNTVASLDMIFIGDDERIQGVLARVPPMNEEPRRIPGISSRYVLELAAGRAAELGIQAGDSINIPDSVRQRK
jgi:uncharacterized membrane protein (UPF0127 family)